MDSRTKGNHAKSSSIEKISLFKRRNTETLIIERNQRQKVYSPVGLREYGDVHPGGLRPSSRFLPGRREESEASGLSEAVSLAPRVLSQNLPLHSLQGQRLLSLKEGHGQSDNLGQRREVQGFKCYVQGIFYIKKNNHVI